MMVTIKHFLVSGFLLVLVTATGQAAISPDTNSNFFKVPPNVADFVYPNVLLDMSVETPMGGAAYPDEVTDLNGDGDSNDIFLFDENGVRTETTAPYTIPPNGKVKHECGGRPATNLGVCYFADDEYLGYFDPNKCYVYDSSGGYFEPSSTTADHTCSGEFSGNFMNWASMTAIDEFIWTMTGGKRLVDTKTIGATPGVTVVGRAIKKDTPAWYPDKRIDNVAPSTVTPWGDQTTYIRNVDLTDQIHFGTSLGAQNLGVGIYNVRIKVCDDSVGLEKNCRTITDGSGTVWHKPEGLIQANAHRMRFGVMAYSNDGDKTRDGGVLRAAMKFVGPVLPDGTPNVLNATLPDGSTNLTGGEFGLDGLQRGITDPDGLAGSGGVTKSGVINYVNEFYVNAGYKSIDPLGELFYECIRYYKNLSPTPEASAGLTNAENGGFPIITNRVDPIQYHCQDNYIIAINDVFAWRDKKVPGTHFQTMADVLPFYTPGWGGSIDEWGEPSLSNTFTDTSGSPIDVTYWTNAVGAAEGLDWRSYGSSSDPNDNYLNDVPVKLGEILAWQDGLRKPHENQRRNTYYAAGLAYYANTQDLRGESNMPNKQTVTTFMIDTQEFNNNPLTGDRNVLYLTGKYGGFNDIDGNGVISNVSEWDGDNDGQPDNYVLASDPQKMIDGLNKAFDNIKVTFRAGTAAAVAPVNRAGEGAVYQAFYEPSRQDSANRRVDWIGTVQSFFLDEKGQLRQDDGDGVLENYAIDKIVESYVDSAGVLKYDVFTPNTGYENDIVAPDCLGDSSVTPVIPTTCTHTRSAGGTDPAAISPLWNAREKLESITSFTSNRTYTSASTTQRHILTWKDIDHDRVIDGTEIQGFIPSIASSNNFHRDLDVGDAAAAQNIIKFIRGEEGIANFRSRSIDYDGNGAEVARLGDIIHSSPKVVGAPFDNYDILYGDSSYATFRQTYANRRQVVYVGANDGMLHAFNGGFYDESTKAFKTQLSTETAHALGAELWAYVPKNLQPHLKWLTIPDYRHTYYMDGAVKVFDAKIFSADATHPGGWGTVLLAGMGNGGAKRQIDIDGNGINVGTDHDFYSAYVLMDITDPESPPIPLAEIQGPNFNSMGLTVSEPAVIGFNTSSDNEWYLVMGNGPDSLSASSSSGNAKIFVYDLQTKSFVTGFGPYTTSLANAYVGGTTSVDWDLDYLVDSVYVGTAGGATGKLFKIDTGENSTANSTNWSVSELLDAQAPIMQKPSLAVDEDGRKWVYVSTGRLETVGDKTSTGQNYMYGVKDDSSLPSLLLDVAEANVYTNGAIDGAFTDSTGSTVSGISDFGALETTLESATYKGWMRSLARPGSGADPSERVVRNSTVFGGVVFTPSYTPTDDLCEGGGLSKLYATYYKTGTAHPNAILTTDNTVQFTDVDGNKHDKVNDAIDLGAGVSSEVKLQTIVDSDGNITVTGFVQNEDGSLVRVNPNIPINLSTGELSWRELRDEK